MPQLALMWRHVTRDRSLCGTKFKTFFVMPDLDELESGHGGKFLDARVEERRGRMVGIVVGQAVDHALWFSRPIWRCEREAVVCSGV